METNFNFLFPITRKVKNAIRETFVPVGSLHVYASRDESGLFAINSIFYESADVLPLIEFLERLSGTPLFSEICDAARNNYESNFKPKIKTNGLFN